MKTLYCGTCNNKKCRQGHDCYDIKQECLDEYSKEETTLTARNASLLIDNGRAGTMSRLQEILEFCRLNQYQRIGLAYCIGMEKLARRVADRLKEAELTPVPVVCTAGGVKEREIDTSKSTETVSCNPVGQAKLLNKSSIDLVIELGLCLGHDILFHQYLDLPFTVLIVKDRVNFHNPALDLDTCQDPGTVFLESMDDSFMMKSPDWLKERLAKSPPPVVIDLRTRQKYDEAHIDGAIHVPLRELPSRYTELLPGRDNTIVVYCNGSVQSAYAISFLYSRGYRDLHNLSGGWSRWERELF
jgi:uncharacterized metal-binding protein/rhodanese-related sulfurtransferase